MEELERRQVVRGGLLRAADGAGLLARRQAGVQGAGVLPGQPGVTGDLGGGAGAGPLAQDPHPRPVQGDSLTG